MVVLSEPLQDILDSLPQAVSFSLPVLKQNPLKIEFEKNKSFEVVYGTASGVEPPLPFADSPVVQASISEWRRLTALDGDCKAVYEITFDLEDNNFDFKPGDTIGVITHNTSLNVNLIITHLDLTSVVDDCYTITLDGGKGSKVPTHVPVKSTIRHVLTHCLDLRSVLKKLFLLALSKHTKDEKERNTLEYLCSKEGSAAYTTHILNKSLCILDIFTIFKTCRPPIEVLLANLPRLLPRPYSIINSQLKNKKQLKICFSVMAINNKKGLTTGWLEDLILNTSLENQIKNLTLDKTKDDADLKLKVPIYLRKNISGFRMPNLNVPLILIGPGTGVSPFIGFLETREYEKLANPHMELGDAWLVFGCRNPEIDFIYKTELEGFLSRNVLNKMNTAFSRIENNGIKYIQDALKQNGEEIIKFIDKGTAIFICGDLKTMAAEVKSVIVQCLIEFGNLSEGDAQKKILEMEKDKRYCVDAWC